MNYIAHFKRVSSRARGTRTLQSVNIYLMSKNLLIVLLILAGVGYYLYKTNYFSQIDAKFDYTPGGVSVEARGADLHDCKLAITNDFEIKLPFLRANTPVMIEKTEFKQWNGTNLEAMRDLGEKMEFKMRCREGEIETSEPNRYYEASTQKKASDSGEVTESNH